MADIRYHIGELFQLAFGVNSPIYLSQPFFPVPTPGIEYSGVNLLPEPEEELPKSWMGTPIVFSAELETGEYKRYRADGTLERVTLPTTPFPPATMFTFRRPKNIVRTNVLGSTGTVKEVYGYDDWHIDVRGLCLPTPQQRALEQLEALLEWENVADSLQIAGSLFSKINVFQVAMENLNWNVPQGQPDVIAYQMRLYSDSPMELNIINEL